VDWIAATVSAPSPRASLKQGTGTDRGAAMRGGMVLSHSGWRNAVYGAHHDRRRSTLGRNPEEDRRIIAQLQAKWSGSKSF
jgi:hypothetical protein